MTALTVLAFVLAIVWGIIYTIVTICHVVWWMASIDAGDEPPWRKHFMWLFANITGVVIIWWLVWYLSHFTS
jgi:hypothetical protein